MAKATRQQDIQQGMWRPLKATMRTTTIAICECALACQKAKRQWANKKPKRKSKNPESEVGEKKKHVEMAAQSENSLPSAAKCSSFIVICI